MDPSKFGMHPQLPAGGNQPVQGPVASQGQQQQSQLLGGGGASNSGNQSSSGGHDSNSTQNPAASFNPAAFNFGALQGFPGGFPGMMANMGGFPGAGQVPLLVGASPFQQQLQALQGMSANGGAPGNVPSMQQHQGGFPGFQQFQGMQQLQNQQHQKTQQQEGQQQQQTPLQQHSEHSIGKHQQTPLQQHSERSLGKYQQTQLQQHSERSLGKHQQTQLQQHSERGIADLTQLQDHQQQGQQHQNVNQAQLGGANSASMLQQQQQNQQQQGDSLRQLQQHQQQNDSLRQLQQQQQQNDSLRQLQQQQNDSLRQLQQQSHQQNPGGMQSQQAQGQPSPHLVAAQSGAGGFNQSALLSAAAMGGNMGFSLQQIQSLQMAQQLMAAGLPPNLAFGGMQQPGAAAAAMSNPLMMAGLANPMMAAQFGAAAGFGGMPGANPMAGFLGMNGMGGPSPVSSTNPLLAAIKPEIKPAAPTGAKAVQPDWAEPFAGKGKKEPPFPLKLHQILSNPEFNECICWNPHGRSWRILKPPVFEQLVIPLYFRHAKYASFMRQVNGWGFKRIVSGNDHNSYFHELFLRDYPQLCLKMKRIRKGEKSGDEDSEGGGGSGQKDKGEKGEDDSTSVSDDDQNVYDGHDAVKQEDATSGREGDTSAGLSAAVPSTPQILSCLGLPTGSTGLATMPQGYNALASLQGQMQNGCFGGAHGFNFSNQQQLGMSGFDVMGGMNAPGMPNSNPTGGFGGPSPVGPDNSSLLKLQEALKSGGNASSILQQQQQASSGSSGSTHSVLNFSNLNFLQGPLGGALAAQLQAATQAPARMGEDKSKGPGTQATASTMNFNPMPTTQSMHPKPSSNKEQESQSDHDSGSDSSGSDK